MSQIFSMNNILTKKKGREVKEAEKPKLLPTALLPANKYIQIVRILEYIIDLKHLNSSNLSLIIVLT